MQSELIGRKVKFASFCQNRTQPLARLPLKTVFHAETVYKHCCCCRDLLTNEGLEQQCILSHCWRHVYVAFLLRKGTLAFQTEAGGLTFQEDGQCQFLLITSKKTTIQEYERKILWQAETFKNNECSNGFNKNQFENFHVYKVTSLNLRAGLCLVFHIDDLGN